MLKYDKTMVSICWCTEFQGRGFGFTEGFVGVYNKFIYSLFVCYFYICGLGSICILFKLYGRQGSDYGGAKNVSLY